jgi:hypothetical protein
MLHAALLNKQLNKSTSASGSVWPRTTSFPYDYDRHIYWFSQYLFGEDSSDPHVKIKKLTKSTERSLPWQADTFPPSQDLPTIYKTSSPITFTITARHSFIYTALG